MTKEILPPNAAIVGIGSYLPQDVVTNNELVRRTGMDSSHEAIESRTGIMERRFCGTELPSYMGIEAARAAIESSRIDPSLFGGLFVSTLLRDMPAPDTAIFIHQKLGLPEDSLTFDLGGICAGGVMALDAAANRTAAEACPTLAVGLGKMSTLANFEDRKSSILFGDGAGAFSVDNVPGANKPTFHFLTIPDPGLLTVRGGGDLHPLDGPDDPEGKIFMDGHAVAAHALDMMPRAAVAAARRAGLYDEKAERIDWNQITAFVPHQANLRLMERVAERLEVPDEKIVAAVTHHGNTSAASIPLALGQAHKEGRFDPSRPNRVLFTAVGSGMVAGACVIDVCIPS